ncbi:hypothetical protein M911_00745 [Ectothiorhodospira haloalkaliphila]|uniref:Uncharacterized protein n=1 Tax=Ectothiorhodospira haloalkaliphila TaxID=421628 RepID=W8KL69_9GAMM|nr:hypothetical protein M911_00745 [Ectothiorhodospira haloalkaliphila]
MGTHHDEIGTTAAGLRQDSLVPLTLNAVIIDILVIGCPQRLHALPHGHLSSLCQVGHHVPGAATQTTHDLLVDHRGIQHIDHPQVGAMIPGQLQGASTGIVGTGRQISGIEDLFEFHGMLSRTTRRDARRTVDGYVR